jgi:hypothetical protein
MKFISLALSLFLLFGCSDSQRPKTYVQFIGGGLTFNYRYSKASIVVVIRRVSPMNQGSKFVCLFDIPGEAAPQRIEVANNPDALDFKFESKALTGIKKGVPLHVSILAVDEKGVQLDEIKKQFVSDVDQDTLPSKPLMDPNTPAYVPQLQNLK